MRPVIYQLFVRHFSNMVVDGVPWGSKDRNGCGSFQGVTREGLTALADMGVTHLWLTGVLRHATRTPYPGLPAQNAAIVKGIAGSPYAVTDYYDVDPDLAQDVDNRMDEFQRLLDRCHWSGIIPMIDFIPNHVSRDYRTTAEGRANFGDDDDTSVFFSRDNAFYYIQQGMGEGKPPFKLPEGSWSGETWLARVTGNNAVTWQPSELDWYETVKLNYGYDFLSDPHGERGLPDFLTYVGDVPRTWRIMDDILHFWQSKGVGGFRVDMAHMVPLAFWKWAISRARVRNSNSLFVAEAYDDHMKAMPGSPAKGLIDSGFAAMYDAPAYHLAHSVYEEGKWANDFDKHNEPGNMLYDKGVRFIENHDEPRICSDRHWGGVGAKVQKAVMTMLYASGKGPVLIYNGQEVGERAEGPGGFGGDNGRTSIFDYTCLPRLAKWVSYGSFEEDNLDKETEALRDYHVKLLCIMKHPALARGDFYGLNWSNMQNFTYGRGKGDTLSGHWVYAFLKHDFVSRKTLLVVCNLSPELDFDDLTVSIPRNALDWCGVKTPTIKFASLINDGLADAFYTPAELEKAGFKCPLKAGEAGIYELENVIEES